MKLHDRSELSAARQAWMRETRSGYSCSLRTVSCPRSPSRTMIIMPLYGIAIASGGIQYYPHARDTDENPSPRKSQGLFSTTSSVGYSAHPGYAVRKVCADPAISHFFPIAIAMHQSIPPHPYQPLAHRCCSWPGTIQSCRSGCRRSEFLDIVLPKMPNRV